MSSLPVPLGLGGRANCSVTQHVTGEWHHLDSFYISILMFNVFDIGRVLDIVGTAKIFSKQNGGCFVQIPEGIGLGYRLEEIPLLLQTKSLGPINNISFV